MSTTPHDTTPAPTPTPGRAPVSWDDVRRIADEVRLQLHLGSMEVRAQWDRLTPRLAELERSIAQSGRQAGAAVEEQLTTLGAELERIRQRLLG